MNLTKVRLTSYRWDRILGKLVQSSENVDFHIVGAQPTDPYLVRDISGLGPPDISVSIGRSVNTDVGYYTGRQIQDREIVITASLNPNYQANQTVESLRGELYKLISSGEVPIRVSLFEGSDVKAYSDGYVTKFEMATFSATPAVQITIRCPSALLTGVADTKLLIPSTAGLLDPIPVNNPGNAPSGMIIEWTITEGNSYQYISTGREYLALRNTYLADDRLRLVTIEGQKSITLYRGTNVYNNLHRVDPGSTWAKIYSGNQNVIISVPAVDVILEYTPKYWGV